MNKRGISLLMAMAMMLIVLSLSMVSLSMVQANSKLNGAIYAQTLVMNGAEDGPNDAIPTLKANASDGWTDQLSTEGAFFTAERTYMMLDGVQVEVSIRDNDDLDDSETDDVDKVFILTTNAYLPNESTSTSRSSLTTTTEEHIAQSQLEVLVKYVGPDDEYAQETGGAQSNSYFEGESDVSF